MRPDVQVGRRVEPRDADELRHRRPRHRRAGRCDRADRVAADRRPAAIAALVEDARAPRGDDVAVERRRVAVRVPHDELPRVRPAVALDRHRVAAAPPPVLQDLDVRRAGRDGHARPGLRLRPLEPHRAADRQVAAEDRAAGRPDAAAGDERAGRVDAEDRLALDDAVDEARRAARERRRRSQGRRLERQHAAAELRVRRRGPEGRAAGGPRGRLDAAVLEREPAPERQGAAPDLEAAVDAEPAGAHVHAAAVDAEPARRDAHAAREHVEGAVAADREDLVRPAERRDDGAVAVAPLEPERRRGAGAARRRAGRRDERVGRRDAALERHAGRGDRAGDRERAERPRPLAREAGPADRDRLVFGDAQRGRVRRARDQEVALGARERGAARERRRAARVERAGDGHAAVERRGPGRADVPVAAHGEHVAAPPAGAHAQVVEVRRRRALRLQAQNRARVERAFTPIQLKRVRVLVVVAGVPPPARAAPALSRRQVAVAVVRARRVLPDVGRDRVLQGALWHVPGVARERGLALERPEGGVAAVRRVRVDRRRRPLVEGDEPPVGRLGAGRLLDRRERADRAAARRGVEHRRQQHALAEEPEAQPAVDLAARRRRDGQRDRARHLVLRQRVVAARAVDLLAGGARHARLADAERGGEGGVGRRAVAPEVAVGRAGRAHGRAEADGDEGEGAAPPHPASPSWPQWRGWAWQPPFLTIWELVSRSHQGEALLFWSSSSGWLLVRQPNLYGTYGTCTPML